MATNAIRQSKNRQLSYQIQQVRDNALPGRQLCWTLSGMANSTVTRNTVTHFTLDTCTITHWSYVLHSASKLVHEVSLRTDKQ